MKKKTKGIIIAAFFGGILLTSGVTIGITGIAPEPEEEETTITGTPMDNFPDSERPSFCGTDGAKSNKYITEYEIPTKCTQPLAVTTDPAGNVWFAQVNTGNVAKFDPNTKTFTEYDNPDWPEKARSMMWGIVYTPDGSLWFTDEAHDLVWKFSINDEKYQRFGYPRSQQVDSLPQRLQIFGSQIIINDFTGNKITFLDAAAQTADETPYLIVPSPMENSFTSGFTIDSNGNLWYTNWVYRQGGGLVKFDQNSYKAAAASAAKDGAGVPLFDFIEVFQLPAGIHAPNGISVGKDGKLWITDTASSLFVSFDPASEEFTKYITSKPHPSSYGNATGVMKSPISAPYWNRISENYLVFNEQTANRIGIFDTQKESLVEYLVPSKNPNWADCEQMDDCGVAQVFDFTIKDDKIWFTEWAENNIGVLDTTVPLPFDISVTPRQVTLQKGDQVEVLLNIDSFSSKSIRLVSDTTTSFSDIVVEFDQKNLSLSDGDSKSIPVKINISKNALSGTYKVLLGAQDNEVSVSQFVTVIIEK